MSVKKSNEEIVEEYKKLHCHEIQGVPLHSTRTAVGEIEWLTQTLEAKDKEREEAVREEREVGLTILRVSREWSKWKKGKDDGYIYDEGYTFFENMSRGDICSLLDEIEALTPPTKK